MNLSWTNFRDKHLFSVNVSIVASIVLWKIRGDFTYHGLVAFWMIGGFFLPLLRTIEKKILLTIGKINGAILLTIFYFFFFTPYSVIYRTFFRNQSFKKLNSTFVQKNDSPDFTRPF